MNDLELWTKFTASLSSDDFQFLYDKSRKQVWTLCFRILRNEEDALDAFQNTYSRLIALAMQPSERDQVSEPLSMICRLAVLESNNLRKRRQRLQAREATMSSDPIEIPQIKHELNEQQLRELIAKETTQLSEELRLPVQLHYLNGMSQREVAKALGISLGLVNKRIKKAFKILSPRFKKAGLDQPNKLFSAILPMAILLNEPASATGPMIFEHALTSKLAAPTLASLQGSASTPLTASALVKIGAIAASIVLAIIVVSSFKNAPEPDQVAISTPLMSIALVKEPEATPEPTATPEPVEQQQVLQETEAPQQPEVIEQTGTTITTQFVDYNTGKPVEGLEVRVYEMTNPNWRNTTPYRAEKLITTGKTTADGYAEISGLPDGFYLIRAINKTHQTFYEDFQFYDEISISNGQFFGEPTYEVFAGNTISGKVTDTNGVPMEGIEITFSSTVPEENQYHRSTITEITSEDGTYEATSVYGSSVFYFLNRDETDNKEIKSFGSNHVRKLSYEINSDHYYIAGSIDSLEGEIMKRLTRERIDVKLDLELNEYIHFSGYAIDQNGNALSGLEVTSSGQKTTTDAEGTFSIKVPKNKQFFITFKGDHVEDLKTDWIKIEKDKTQSDPFKLSLKKDLYLFLEVVDSNGNTLDSEPMLKRKMYYQKGRSSETHYTPDNHNIYEEIAHGKYKIKAPSEYIFDDRGNMIPSFKYEKIEVFVEATAEGYESGKTEPITFESAMQHDTFKVILTKIPVENKSDQPWFSGRITDANGQPVVAAMITSQFTSEYSAVTDEDGRYLLEGISEKTRMLKVRHPELGITRIENIQMNHSYNDLVWDNVNAIAEVKVVDQETKEAIQDFTVTTVYQKSQNAILSSTDAGVFYIEQAFEPMISGSISAPGYQLFNFAIPVEEGVLLINQTIELEKTE